ncbi:hypothetical protein ACLI1A_11600 [Flavobacterium sp. RHBU_3]|uniref:hypothetical protein n=1 Tax=Flavobacterium sp. RHBU_3 TaxID=3391184 RepID=UPI00398480B8
MYIRLENNMTKKYFREIVNVALIQAEKEYNSVLGNALSQSFYNQLKDIKKTVIEENIAYTQNKAYERYPMSIMAKRNFEDDPRDYLNQLSDIVWGISLYPAMPEE